MRTFEVFIFVPWGGQYRARVSVQGQVSAWDISTRSEDFYFPCLSDNGNRLVTCREMFQDGEFADEDLAKRVTYHLRQMWEDCGTIQFASVPVETEFNIGNIGFSVTAKLIK